MDMVPGKLSKSTVSLVEDIHKKEEQVMDTLIPTVSHTRTCTHTHTHTHTLQVAELTKEWASKWKDIQQIIEVITFLDDMRYNMCCHMVCKELVLYTNDTTTFFHTHSVQARDVALHSEGAKMVVHSDQPHLVGIDPDILSTGLVFFYLKVSCHDEDIPVHNTYIIIIWWCACSQGDSTTVGSVSANPPADIGKLYTVWQ